MPISDLITLRSICTARDNAIWDRAEKFIKTGFWGLNIGLGLMILLDLFPGGALQLWDVIENGYWHARRLTFLMGGLFHTLEWIRMVADLTFLLVGAVPIALAVMMLLINRTPRKA